jgi:uncharacterized 2Fe-2S/4Fe-4S cluster protein (DUF4445 family)
MPKVKIIFGDQTITINAKRNTVIGEVIAKTELPLEQPCAGRGTCGLCKILHEYGLAPPDEIELKHLTRGEIAVGNRLACRAQIAGDTRIVLSPIVVYSNKIFRGSNRYKKEKDVPLGLAIDLGSTTVAAFLTMMDNGEVCAGAASLNQQSVYGADVISRLSAANRNKNDADRLRRLALASINQAVDSLKLSIPLRKRIQRAAIVCNPAMHHLLTGLQVHSLAVMPFQPYQRNSIYNASHMMGGIFPEHVEVNLPPLIGGFVGSDALACLVYFEFDRTVKPMAAIDLGTNGEVMVTDGQRILVASTAAGPAFEGVNISCGSRAVDGAVTKVYINGSDIAFDTISDEDPVGLTGSGLLSAIHEFRKCGMIINNGQINPHAELLAVDNGKPNSKSLLLTQDGRLRLHQLDIRELQKAKGAIRAAIDVLMERLDLKPEDLERLILTGSFGGQVDIEAVLSLGMIPPVPIEVIETIPNGAGFGAAMMLTDHGFEHAESIAETAEQVDLDLDKKFFNQFINGMSLEQYYE